MQVTEITRVETPLSDTVFDPTAVEDSLVLAAVTACFVVDLFEPGAPEADVLLMAVSPSGVRLHHRFGRSGRLRQGPTGREHDLP